MRESEHGVYPGLLLFGVHSVSGVGFLNPIGHTEDSEVDGGSCTGKVSAIDS